MAPDLRNCHGVHRVRERSRGVGRHTHILVHLGSRPEALSNQLSVYLSEKFLFGPEGVKITHGRFGANTAQMRAGLLRYILKGIDASAFRYTGLAGETESIAEALGIQFSGNQGLITSSGAVLRRTSDRRLDATLIG